MGVAYGRLKVTPAYGSTPADSAVRVRPEGEPFFEPVGGVNIEDIRDELGDDEIHVSVQGLDSEIYAQCFPHHVQAYAQQFRKTK
jgi:hypothetical protein